MKANCGSSPSAAMPSWSTVMMTAEFVADLRSSVQGSVVIRMPWCLAVDLSAMLIKQVLRMVKFPSRMRSALRILLSKMAIIPLSVGVTLWKHWSL